MISRHTLTTIPNRILLTAAVALTVVAGCDQRADTSTHAGHDHDHADAHDHDGGGHTDEVSLTPESIARYGVQVQPAQLWALRPTFTAPARVGFNTEAMAHVGSPLRGRAVEVHVRLGDPVKKGQPLLTVESPELGEAQADYFQKRILAETSGPAVDLARGAWERAKDLHEQSQGISLTEVQRREAEFKAAAAARMAADAGVVSAENRLHLLGMPRSAIAELAKTGEIAPRSTIHAPIDGQVVQREVTLGELVSPDREALMVLADTTTLWVLADVPEARVHEVAVGAVAWVTVGGSAGPAGAPRSHEGRIAFIAPLVDAATRTAQVRIEIPAAALALKPGMFAQVEIVATPPAPPPSGDAADPPAAAAPQPAPIVAVPDEAVQTIEGGPAVFVPVKGEPNTFAPRAVRVGQPVGRLVPILAGLVEGEEFVVSGTFILKAELGKGSAAHEH